MTIEKIFPRTIQLLLILGWISSLFGCVAPPATVNPGSFEPLPTPTSFPTPGPANIQNPGFEQQDANGLPVGWSNTGLETAIHLENLPTDVYVRSVPSKNDAINRMVSIRDEFL